MPDVIQSIPTMLSRPVLDRLRDVGAGWSGRGLAVEIGCWLGASTAALGEGLASAGYSPRLLHCYDRWRADHGEVEKARRRGIDIEADQDLTPLFVENVLPYYSYIEPHRGEAQKAKWIDEPIEIFILDAAKCDRPLRHVLREFGPSWIPGVTIVGLMDYWFYLHKKTVPTRCRYKAQRRFVTNCGNAFTPLWDMEAEGPAIFRYEKPIDFDAQIRKARMN